MFCCYSRGQNDEAMDLGVLRNIFKRSEEDEPCREKPSLLAKRRPGATAGEGGLGLMLRISSPGVVWIASVKSDGPAALQVPLHSRIEFA